MKTLFCFGFGYSAKAVARILGAKGWRITGTATSAARAAAIAAEGYTGLLFDGAGRSEAVAQALRESTHILLSIPPDAAGDPALRHHGGDIQAAASVRWIGYYSTVGVYGDANGGWVDEDTPATPLSERGQRRLAAENAWRALGVQSGKCVNVFRLPGIYGPGRSALDDMRAGTARRIVKKGQVFNRIHVDDIARVTVAGIERANPGGVYNVTDDEPGPPQDVVAYAASLLGAAPPPELDFETAELSAMARSFYSESKRVSNARMKRELGLTLAYPTYREGLAAILAHTKSKNA